MGQALLHMHGTNRHDAQIDLLRRCPPSIRFNTKEDLLSFTRAHRMGKMQRRRAEETGRMTNRHYRKSQKYTPERV